MVWFFVVPGLVPGFCVQTLAVKLHLSEGVIARVWAVAGCFAIYYPACVCVCSLSAY